MRNLHNGCIFRPIVGLHRICRAGLGAFIVLVLQIASAQIGEEVSASPGFTVEGVISNNFFGSSGNKIQELCKTDAFTFSARADGAWVMLIRPIGSTNDFSYVTFDRTNQYSVHYDDIAKDDRGRPTADHIPINANNHFAYLSKADFPAFCDYNARIVWLAFGSGVYLALLSSNAVSGEFTLPWYNEQYNPLAYGCQVSSDSLPEFPYLASIITFIRSTNLDFEAGQDLHRKGMFNPGSQEVYEWELQKLKERQLRWTNGFVAGSYIAKDITNFHSMRIPINFECRGFQPGYGRIPYCEFIGHLTAITVLDTNISFQPPILGTVHVADARFSYPGAVDNIRFALQSGSNWPSMDNPNLKMLFNRALQAAPEVYLKYRHPGTASLVRVAFFVLLSGPLIYLLVLHLRCRWRRGR